MKILLAANASYSPPRGGATRSNRIWMESLAAHGNICRIVSTALVTDHSISEEQLAEELIAAGEIAVGNLISNDRSDILFISGVEIHSVKERSQMREYFKNQILNFQPDWVLISSEDVGLTLLSIAIQLCPGHVIYLAHTPQLFPFGPASFNPNPDGHKLLNQTTAIIAIGDESAKYIEENTSIKPVVIHPPIYGKEPFLQYGGFHKGSVLIINPCAVKGISIFFDLANTFPTYQFAALPGWGTTQVDLRNLIATPNVKVVKPCQRIDEVFAQTTVLLVPSLWQEGFGLVVVEAMCHGIPVLASNFGGLKEAKLGTDYLLPVQPIKNYESCFDDKNVPIPLIPEQNITPWVNALSILLSNQASYEQASETSNKAAEKFILNIGKTTLEEFLENVTPGQNNVAYNQSKPGVQNTKLINLSDPLSSLSDGKRTLLALQLAKLNKKGK